MTAEELRFGEAVLRWVRICMENEYPAPGQLPSDADLWHSALLRRLLDGKMPLSTPPPLWNSYPWYELVEEGHAAIPGEVRESAANGPVPHCLVFCGNAWPIVEKRSELEYVVQNRGRWRVCYTHSLQPSSPLPAIRDGWEIYRDEP